MLGKYISDRNISQEKIVSYVKGKAENTGASDSEVTKAIKYGVGSKYTVTNFTVVDYPKFYQSIYSNKIPDVVKIHWNTGGNHVFVVSGVNGSLLTLQLIDPIKCVPRKWYKYTAMVNGTYFEHSKGTYIHTFIPRKR